jgi:hypothetical protein
VRNIFVIFAVLAAKTALAAETHAEHGAPGAEQWKLLAFSAINFAIFIALMVRLARSPLRDFLVNRRQSVVDSMEEAARLKARPSVYEKSTSKKRLRSTVRVRTSSQR